jgi:hypothetical protein
MRVGGAAARRETRATSWWATRACAASMAATLAIGAAACSGGDAERAATGTAPVATVAGTTSTETQPPSTDRPRFERPLTEREEAYADAVVAASASGQNFFDEDQAACIAPRFVVLLGADELEAIGITPEDVASGDRHLNERRVDRPTATQMVDAMVACGFDLVDGFVRQSFPDGAAPAARACVVATVDEDEVRSYLEVAWSGGDLGEVMPDIARCR